MPAWLTAALEKLRAFSPTPRERAGLAVLGLAAAVMLLVAGLDWSAGAEDAANSAHEERAIAERDARNFTNPQAQEQVGIAAGKIWSWSVVDVTEAIAQVRAVGELQNVAQQAGVANVTVELVGANVGRRGPSGFNTFEFVVGGDFDWQSFNAFLGALDQSELSIAPQSIEVSAPGGQKRFAMVVRVPFLPQDRS